VKTCGRVSSETDGLAAVSSVTTDWYVLAT
jgi:hypothetical protein